MSSILGFLQRNWQIISPPSPPPKQEGALKFGILGAANIGPNALIHPASLHPEVIVQAVAARDKAKAEAYARKHGIPEVKATYDDLLADPSITCVYIPLPNGLHYEWALKSLQAGKHVLLEKPSVSNSVEAELLFSSSIPPGLVLLEAFHYRFQPSWLLFLQQLDPENVASAKVDMHIPSVLFGKDDVRFKYELGGGALMDLTYTMSVLRGIFKSEPAECLDSKVETVSHDPRVDYKYSGVWQFPNGGIGETSGSLQAGLIEAFSGFKFARAKVVHKPVAMDGKEGEERVRTVRMANWVMGAMYHRIEVEDEYVLRDRDTREVVKRWKVNEVKKAYTFREAGVDQDSEPYWLTYKHQLDAFVDRVKGRESKTGAWISGEDSINQARMIDMAYEKAGLPLRPTSEYRAVQR